MILSRSAAGENSNAWEAWLRWVLPDQCSLCRDLADGAPNLCQACERELPRPDTPCSRCGAPSGEEQVCLVCLGKSPPYAAFIAALRYRGAVVDLIHRYKFGHDLTAGTSLAGILGQAAQGFKKFRLNCIVPMPLHPRKLQERGFNQCVPLAAAVSRQLQIPIVHGLLRHRDTEQQAMLRSNRARSRNLAGAFAVASDMQNRTIILLDDVCTSGATLRSATRALLRAHAAAVVALVAARA